MSKDRPIYVIDTNILVDYVDVIPGEDGKQPLEPTIDLSNAHIVIPTVVVRELSNFKGEKSDRGLAARVVLRRLLKLFEGSVHTMEEIYNLRAPIEVPVRSHCNADGEPNALQLVSILPVHKDLRKCLPFYPSDEDMDGQIILTAIAASLADQGKWINGRELPGVICHTLLDNVVLLTNDNGLAIRARERGLITMRYGYKYPEPYTGRRDIEVPKELLEELLNCRSDGYYSAGVSRAMFEELMPDEPGLVANEFIVMGLAQNETWPAGFNPDSDPYFSHIGRYDLKEDAIVPLKYVSSFPTAIKNAGQAIYAEALMHPGIAAVVCTGPAGSGKTYMATIFGYRACQEGKFIGVTAVPCENRSNIGALPGDLDEKMDPDVQPLKNALRNYLLNNDPKLRKELANLQKYGTECARSKKGKTRDSEAEYGEYDYQNG
ncbi:PhoH family protein, partial [Candidatus Saccharibacteria bacterium]|nr:PhoH family protein [Candidatus Saccharibacteria bacterium]